MKFPELSALYHQPFFDLISQSRAVHLQHWRGEEVQRCSLLSIKTGGCSEDCAYCAQSAHYSTGVEREELLSLENVLAAARRALSQGAGRFCMGAAWRGGPNLWRSQSEMMSLFHWIIIGQALVM